FDAEPPTQFGASLALAGRELLVGAPAAGHYSGVVYRFTGDGASRIAVPGLDPDSRTFTGMTLAAGPAAAVVGIPGQDFYQGGAALLARKPGGWNPAHLVVGETKGLEALTGRKRDCTGGKVGRFDCHQVDLLSFLPIRDIGGGRGVELNDIWGYSDPATGHDFALVGRVDGTAFVDITDPSHPVYVGQLPKTAGSPSSSWRDIKTYKHYAFIVSDAAREHGMQVFDLDKLRHPGRMPVTFTEDAHYSRIHSAHNIVVDTSTGFAYIVGSSGGGEMCGGGLHMVDIRDPLHPGFAGCFSDPATGRAGTGYTHDAQCVVYHGPQAKYQGHEICFNFNETAVEIADVTDKAHPVALSHQGYPNVGYAHQGWLTEDQKYLYEDDELDEVEGLVTGTRTLIWDVSDLDNPVLAGEYSSQDHSSDHNLFVVGDTVYQANYRSGLRVLDIADRLHPTQIGYFDTMPVGADDPGFEGAWGNYPFFKSGVVAVSSIDEGLFVLKTHSNEVLP
ncbi:MAG TPA: choice-of-anchor B family protein, partial [Gemmatimonadales bacterium]|nr:choice-of-anchor B family protein [Gemmatimonadales bacterium]